MHCGVSLNIQWTAFQKSEAMAIGFISYTSKKLMRMGSSLEAISPELGHVGRLISCKILISIEHGKPGIWLIPVRQQGMIVDDGL